MKSRNLALVALATLGTFAVATPAFAHDNHHHVHTATLLKAQLRGADEVPANALGGHGKADIKVEGTTVCFDLHVTTTTAAAAAHIHSGAVGVNGPVVITLTPLNPSGTSKGCVTGVDPTLITSLLAHPDQYYVNVHTIALPGGDIRGQLRLHDHRKH